MGYLKDNWKELCMITAVMVFGIWFLLLISERVVPWSDPLISHISIPIK